MVDRSKRKYSVRGGDGPITIGDNNKVNQKSEPTGPPNPPTAPPAAPSPSPPVDTSINVGARLRASLVARWALGIVVILLIASVALTVGGHIEIAVGGYVLAVLSLSVACIALFRATGDAGR